MAEIDEDLEAIPQRHLDPTVLASISYMDLSFNRITSLTGLDIYDNLETLILDNNSLTDESIDFPLLRRLRVLSLNKNYILDLKLLLKNLQRAAPKLRFLSLLNNPACPTEMENSSYTAIDYQNYRLSSFSKRLGVRARV